MGASVFDTVDPRGIKRNGKVQTFSSVAAEGEAKWSVGMTVNGVVVSSVWGLNVDVWMMVDRYAARVLMVIYGILATWCVVVNPVAILLSALVRSGAVVGAEVEFARVAVQIRDGVQIAAITPLVNIIGLAPLCTSLWCVAVMFAIRAERGGIGDESLPGEAVRGRVLRETWADVLMALSALTIYVYPSIFTYTFAFIISSYAAGEYYGTFLRRVERTRGGLMVVVVLTVMCLSACLGVVSLTLARRTVLYCPTEQKRDTGQLGFPDIYRQVNEILGLDMKKAETIMRSQEFRSLYCGGVNTSAETSEVRRLAWVGDRALSLALANRAYREGWTVESVNNKSQEWLSNAAFAFAWEAYLQRVFPQIAIWKESRKGTLVEALVGISYLSTGNIDNIEEFIFSKIAPVVVARGYSK